MYGTDDTFLRSEIDYRAARVRAGTAGSRRRSHGLMSRVRRPGSPAEGTR